MVNELPVPSSIPLPAEARLEDIEDAALEFYQRVAEADRRIGEVERRLRTEMSEKSRSANRLIALLAAQRFEFERLVRRLGPELERRNAGDIMQILDLYARAWDLNLGRAALQVVDLTGQPLDEKLAEDVEVESHVPDPSVSQTMVRETLVPLVLLEGRPIGLAKIVTSVPVTTEEKAE